MKRIAMACGLAALAAASNVQAATQVEQCEAARNQIAAQYYSCREKAEAKAILRMSTPNYGKCAATFSSKWSLADVKYGLDCIFGDFVDGHYLVTVTAPVLDGVVSRQSDTVAAIVAGTDVVPSCGDNRINAAGEQCDGTALGGMTCRSLGFVGGNLACVACAFDTSGCRPARLPATGVTTSLVTGEDDGAQQAGAPLDYTDNGDGTITDSNTGLMWEKKVKLDSTFDPADLHDADNTYSWSGTCLTGGAECGTDADCGANGPCNAPYPPTPDVGFTGVTIFTWLAALNAARFAGYDDWRIPNVRELQSILNLGVLSQPAVSAAFQGASCGTACTDLTDPACSCTNVGAANNAGDPSHYWSSTIATLQLDQVITDPNLAPGVYVVLFDNGQTFLVNRTGHAVLAPVASVRAVRGP